MNSARMAQATAVVLVVGGILGSGTAVAAGNGNGPGNSGGDALSIQNLPSGSMTATQRQRLAGLADEEKLALDVYRALAAKFPSGTQFARIAASEERHLALVRELLRRYRVSDPTAGRSAGSFASPRLAGLYRQFSAASSLSSASAAGRAIEKDDLVELAKARVGVTAPDVKAVYANLTTGSQRHLRAFGG